MEGYRTATLDLNKHRKKNSVPLADSEDEVMQGYGGQDFVSELLTISMNDLITRTLCSVGVVGIAFRVTV
jgi:hypothetical protein